VVLPPVRGELAGAGRERRVDAGHRAGLRAPQDADLVAVWRKQRLPDQLPLTGEELTMRQESDGEAEGDAVGAVLAAASTTETSFFGVIFTGPP
jgi:hypothetical protein